jgi:hypothetical protein
MMRRYGTSNAFSVLHHSAFLRRNSTQQMHSDIPYHGEKSLSATIFVP